MIESRPAMAAVSRSRVALFLVLTLLLLLAAFLPANAEPLFPKNLPLPNGWAPEGIATGRGTDFYVGSLANGGIYKGDLRTGEGAVLNEGASGRALAGLKVDKRTNYVFAAGTRSGKAFVFEGNTGALLAEYQLTTATPTFINDVVITRDAAYFTDSSQPYLYKLPLGPGGSLPAADAVEAILLSGDYVFVPGAFNANGIDAPFNGKVLIVVHSSRGELYAVNPDTGAARLIDLNGGSVPNGDGILLDGKTLYVVQNRLNQIAVIDLKVTRLEGTIVSLIKDPAFRVPTTIAGFGTWLYAVNARFGTPVTPDTDYDVVRVDK
jgi:DNA-binding beta-propeller fold protein YncE